MQKINTANSDLSQYTGGSLSITKKQPERRDLPHFQAVFDEISRRMLCLSDAAEGQQRGERRRQQYPDR